MTLFEAQALADCLLPNEELILDGDRKELQIWQQYETGSRSVLLLKDWRNAHPALGFPMSLSLTSTS